MSKGSLFWSRGRGKLGEIVLSQLKGQQIARAYQPNVANPKTTPQVRQRARFANAVKFYKRATKNFFAFAYEDKKPQESYYNAFMRKNSNVAMIADKSSYNDSNYPAIGNLFLMTEGRLTPVDYALSLPLDSWEVKIAPFTSEGNPTVGEVSQAFITYYGYQDGDIITFVAIGTSIETISEEPADAPSWYIYQFVLDANDSRIFATLINNQYPNAGDFVTLDTSTGSLRCGSAVNDYAGGFAAICSRKVTGNELYVSTAYLKNNTKANSIYQASLQPAYRGAALSSWGAQGDPILKGAIAAEKNV